MRFICEALGLFEGPISTAFVVHAQDRFGGRGGSSGQPGNTCNNSCSGFHGASESPGDRFTCLESAVTHILPCIRLDSRCQPSLLLKDNASSGQ